MSGNRKEVVDQIARGFCRKIIEHREFVDRDSRAVDILMILETLSVLIERFFVRQKLTLKAGSVSVDDNGVYSFEFGNEAGDAGLLVRCVPLRESKRVSVNVLERSGKNEHLVTKEVGVEGKNTGDESINHLVDELSSGVIEKLKMEQNEKKVELNEDTRSNLRVMEPRRPLGYFPEMPTGNPFYGGGFGGSGIGGIGGPGFGGPGFGGGHTGPGIGPGFWGPTIPFGNPEPFPPQPHIRIDPVYPPGLGIPPVPDPDHYRPPRGDDFPRFGNNSGELMGPNHPYFQGRTAPDFNPRRGGPERGNFGLPENSMESSLSVGSTSPLGIQGIDRMRAPEHSSQPVSDTTTPSQSNPPVNFGRRVDQSSQNPSNVTTFFNKP
jgi:hypothetical protein